MEQLTNLLLAVVIVGYVFNFIYKKMNKNTVISKIDNRSYEVRKLPDSQDAADKLAVISERLTQLVEQVTRHDLDREGVGQLKRNFNSRNIIENTPKYSKHLDYGINIAV